MSKVCMSSRIYASSDKVWDVLKDFNGLPAFIAAIEESTTEGMGAGVLRTLIIRGGGRGILEKLEKIDDRAKTLSYSIIDSPLPVKEYLATVEVEELDQQCEVRWHCTFEPKDVPEAVAIRVVEELYTAALEGLKKLFG